jgi:hypothetical protein
MDTKSNSPISAEDFKSNYIRESDLSAKKKTVAGALYLTEVLANKDVIISLIKNSYKLTIIWSYLTDRKAITVPYNSFAKIVREQLLHCSSVQSWIKGEEFENIESRKPSMKVQNQVKRKINDNAKKTNSGNVKKEDSNSTNQDLNAIKNKSQNNSDKKQFKVPSFDNWDGDSTKYIDDWIG